MHVDVDCVSCLTPFPIGQIVESLFELMYRSAEECPVRPYQEGLSQLQATGGGADCEMPYAIDPSWQHNCSITLEGRTALVVQESCPGYAIGLVPLANGRYTWKVHCPLEWCGRSHNMSL